MYRVGARHDNLQDLLISRDIGSWVSLGPDEQGGHSTALKDFTCAFEACDGDFAVSRVREPVWVNDGMIASIVRSDGNIATREGRNQGDTYGCIILEVWGTENKIIQMAGVCIKRKNLDVGPVRTESRIQCTPSRI